MHFIHFFKGNLWEKKWKHICVCVTKVTTSHSIPNALGVLDSKSQLWRWVVDQAIYWYFLPLGNREFLKREKTMTRPRTQKLIYNLLLELWHRSLYLVLGPRLSALVKRGGESIDSSISKASFPFKMLTYNVSFKTFWSSSYKNILN